MSDAPEVPDDAPHVVEDDLGQSELIESAGTQNSIAVAGPGALAMVPVAWALTALGRALRKLRRG